MRKSGTAVEGRSNNLNSVLLNINFYLFISCGPLGK